MDGFPTPISTVAVPKQSYEPGQKLNCMKVGTLLLPLSHGLTGKSSSWKKRPRVLHVQFYEIFTIFLPIPLSTALRASVMEAKQGERPLASYYDLFMGHSYFTPVVGEGRDEISNFFEIWGKFNLFHPLPSVSSSSLVHRGEQGEGHETSNFEIRRKNDIR